MTEFLPSPQFEEELRAVLAAPDASPVFVSDLRARLLNRAPQVLAKFPPARGASPAQPLRPFRMRLGWAVALGLLFVLIAATLIIGPQRVLAAFRSLFGYVPGIGLVENNAGLRLLAEPAQVERDGITLTVEQGAADSLHTIIVYQANGLSLAAANSQGEGAATGGPVVLLLPDGSILTATGWGGGGWGTGYRSRLVFPAIPAGVDEVTLMISRLETMPPGVAPEDWQISLRFKPAPPDMTVMPVYELSTPLPSISSPTPEAATEPSPAATSTQSTQPNVSAQHGITLSLDQVIELEDGYLLQGSLSWTEQAGLSYADFLNSYMLVDANGQSIPGEPSQPEGITNTNPEHGALWAVRIMGKGYPGPWTFTVSLMRVGALASSPFQIDLGADPQVGQTLELNQELETAGHRLRLISARLYVGPNQGEFMMNVGMETDPAVVGVYMDDPDKYLPPPGTSGGGGGGGGGEDLPPPGKITSNILYYKKPSGIRKIVVLSVDYNQDGPWQVSWNPPTNGQPLVAPTAQPQACLTGEMWQQIKTQPPVPLPQGLAGRLLLERLTNNNQWQLSLVNLGGSQLQDITLGFRAALSPDGSTIAFEGSNFEGISLADVRTGQVIHLQGTTSENWGAVWSPDSQWVAFLGGGEQAIYRIHPDGTGLSLVLKGGYLVYPAAWTPDGRRIVYQQVDPDGISLQAVDVQTGQTETLIKTGMRKPVVWPVLSPDGSWIAYRDWSFGQADYGLYVAHLDGTEKKPIVEGASSMVGPWSPDGKWLLVTISEYPADNPQGQNIETPLLIQPDTCQVIPLQGIQGDVVSWVAAQP